MNEQLDVRHRPKHTIYWAAATVLAVVIGVGGLALLQGKQSVELDDSADKVNPTDIPVNTPREYDVFSDPNVLWGDGDVDSEQRELNHGEIEYGYEMKTMLEQASEQNLIAFRLIPNGNYVVNADRLVIHEELAQYEELAYWINHSGDYDAFGQLALAASSFFIENTNEIGQQMVGIRNQIRYRLWNERGYDGLPSEEWDAFELEVDALAMEDEHYRALFEIYQYYSNIESDFRDSLFLQRAETIRNLFVERGFTPVYEFDFDEAFRSDRSERAVFSEHAITFVGTAEQIMQIKDTMKENECYWILSAEKYPRTEL